MSDLFEKLRDPWKPIYNPDSKINCIHVGDLPKPLHIENEFLSYGDTKIKQKVVTCGLREDGPDAWGASFSLNEKVLFRWKHSPDEDGDWYITTEKSSGYVCTGGNYLETIELIKDDTVEWVLYEFLDYLS